MLYAATPSSARLETTRLLAVASSAPFAKFAPAVARVFRLVLGNEFHQMFHWLNHAGFKADIEELRRRYPEVHLRSLEEWLRDEGRHKRARHVRAPKG